MTKINKTCQICCMDYDYCDDHSRVKYYDEEKFCSLYCNNIAGISIKKEIASKIKNLFEYLCDDQKKEFWAIIDIIKKEKYIDIKYLKDIL